jgi:hypothetical protein
MLLKSSLVRAARTLIQFGLGWLIVQIPAAEGFFGGSLGVEVAAAGVATAVVSFAWNKWLDPSPIPSLVDKYANPDVEQWVAHALDALDDQLDTDAD